MTGDSHETRCLIDRLAAGEQHAMNRLLERHRASLRKIVDIRLPSRLRQRVDASDVVQEAELDAFTNLERYLDARPMPFYLWLRRMALQRLSRVCERHIQAAKRSVERELSLSTSASEQLCRRLVDTKTPSQHAVQRDLMKHIKAALARLSDVDREILLMRHVEKLTNTEIADVLGLTRDAVAKRHMRCIVRLRESLQRSGIEIS